MSSLYHMILFIRNETHSILLIKVKSHIDRIFRNWEIHVSLASDCQPEMHMSRTKNVLFKDMIC